jgi:hypothetical protein
MNSTELYLAYLQYKARMCALGLGWTVVPFERYRAEMLDIFGE